MASVKRRPGSYVERVKSARVSTDLASTSIGGVIGETVRGPVGEAVLITSWTEFTDTFARGVSNPFTVGNVAKAVYGFFQNGGKEIYVARAVSSTLAKAKGSIEGITINAKDGGSWGNALSVTIENGDSAFTVRISLQGLEVETFKNIQSNQVVNYVNTNSEYVTFTGDAVTVGTVSLSTGVEGTLTASDYTKCLTYFNVITDVNMLAITGVTTTGVQEALLDYCSLRGNIFPIIDAPSEATREQVQTFKDGLAGYHGALYYPEIQIVNPITGETEYIAPSGHLMGMCARTDSERGIHKAPAGLEATLKGAVGVRTLLSDTDVEILNDHRVNCIIPKKGYGIVSWGARLLEEDDDRAYISDLRLDMFIEETIKSSTEWAVFEPKDEQLFNRIESQLTGFFTNLWQEGKILGEEPEDAFFVSCNAELNPDSSSPTLNIEVGYARKTPAEFVVTRITHKQTSAE